VNDGKWQVSTAGGLQTVWAHNGREIFFANPDPRTGGLEVAPTQVFGLAAFAPLRFVAALARSYDVSPVRVADAGKLIIVQNFFEELKRLVPN
jgi:hypothetical protein